MVTAVISLKGGVGKTTTTVHLAAALAEAGRRVLLMDLDPNGSASCSLGFGSGSVPVNGADVLLRGASISEAITQTAVENLDLVSSSADLRATDIELRSLSRRIRVIRDAVADIREDYDHIFFDCAPSWNDLMKGAVVASDGFLIPTTPHFLAIEGVAKLKESAERVALHAGFPSRFLGVVLNMVDYRSRKTRERVAAIRDRFGKEVFAVEIRVNISIAEAPAEGQTVFQYEPYSTGARAYRLLAAEFLGAVPKRS